MKLTEEEVRYVADLANLDLTNAEIERMIHDLGEVLSHIEKLNEVDTSGVEPMAQVLFQSSESSFRPDVERESLGTETALANAPVKGGGYFKVPKVIER